MVVLKFYACCSALSHFETFTAVVKRIFVSSKFMWINILESAEESTFLHCDMQYRIYIHIGVRLCHRYLQMRSNRQFTTAATHESKLARNPIVPFTNLQSCVAVSCLWRPNFGFVQKDQWIRTILFYYLVLWKSSVFWCARAMFGHAPLHEIFSSQPLSVLFTFSCACNIL